MFGESGRFWSAAGWMKRRSAGSKGQTTPYAVKSGSSQANTFTPVPSK